MVNWVFQQSDICHVPVVVDMTAQLELESEPDSVDVTVWLSVKDGVSVREFVSVFDVDADRDGVIVSVTLPESVPRLIESLTVAVSEIDGLMVAVRDRPREILFVIGRVFVFGVAEGAAVGTGVVGTGVGVALAVGVAVGVGIGVVGATVVGSGVVGIGVVGIGVVGINVVGFGVVGAGVGAAVGGFVVTGGTVVVGAAVGGADVGGPAVGAIVANGVTHLWNTHPWYGVHSN